MATMDIDWLTRVCCPYCENSLRVRILYDNNSSLYGIVACQCDEYPIIDSILILKKPINKLYVPFIRKKQLHNLSNYLFDLRRYYNAYSRYTHPKSIFSRFYQSIFSKTFYSHIGINNVLKPLGLFPDSREWAKYLIRLDSSAESYVLPKILQSATKIRTVVDIGSGLSTYGKNITSNISALYCVDISFTLLYLTKIFYGNSSFRYICSDLNQGYPIKKNTMDLVFSTNALTFIYKQQKIFESMNSSVRKNGIVFAGDMHSPTSENPPDGYLRAPDFYTSPYKNKFIAFNYDFFLESIRTHSLIDSMKLIKKNGLLKERYGLISNLESFE